MEHKLLLLTVVPIGHDVPQINVENCYLSSYLDKILGDTKDANVAQNIAHVLDFKVKQQ